MNKLLIICGPTASGKTSLGVKIGQEFKGEIISADSRQVYQGMDIVTGKDLPLPIPTWGLDLVKPNEEFSASHWLIYAQKAIQDIWNRGKLPIIVGGTGFWIKNLLRPPASIGIPPDKKLRKRLSNYSIVKLSNCLKKLDKARWQRMNSSDRKNPRRLIRAIEICRQHLKNLPATSYKLPATNCLIIGLRAPYAFLYQRIDQRVDERVKQGAIKETKRLMKKGYNLDLPAMSGIGYQQLAAFLQKQKTKDEAIQAWKYSEHAYARRQMTFFRKMFQINWFDISSHGWQKKVVKLIKTWYSNDNARKN